MKTTLELPDDLVREIKVRAAREDKKLKDLVEELLRRGLAEAGQMPPPDTSRNRVKLPLVQGKAASPGQELTPDRIAEILIEQDAEWYSGR